MSDLTNDDLKAFLAATERETGPLSPQLRDYIVKLNAELAQLRAELARLKPLAEAAVALWQGGKPSYPLRFLLYRDMENAANEYAAARAQAQAGEGA